MTKGFSYLSCSDRCNVGTGCRETGGECPGVDVRVVWWYDAFTAVTYSSIPRCVHNRYALQPQLHILNALAIFIEEREGVFS